MREDELAALVVRCPGCGHESIDLDGFGFVACEACGHCTHPTISATPTGYRCDLCGRIPPSINTEGRT